MSAMAPRLRKSWLRFTKASQVMAVIPHIQLVVVHLSALKRHLRSTSGLKLCKCKESKVMKMLTLSARLTRRMIGMIWLEQERFTLTRTMKRVALKKMNLWKSIYKRSWPDSRTPSFQFLTARIRHCITRLASICLAWSSKKGLVPC